MQPQSDPNKIRSLTYVIDILSKNNRLQNPDNRAPTKQWVDEAIDELKKINNVIGKLNS